MVDEALKLDLQTLSNYQLVGFIYYKRWNVDYSDLGKELQYIGSYNSFLFFLLMKWIELKYF